MKQALAKFTERFGGVMSRLLLSVLYYGVLGPFALVYQLVADPLHLRRRKDGNWTPWPERNSTLAQARKQD